MKIKLLNDLATVPTKGTKDSAGWDLYAALDCPITIDPNQTIVIPTAIAVEIPQGYFGGLYARSGLSVKQGLALINGVGVLDSDYRGEIGVALHNFSNFTRQVNPKDRIAQLIIQPYKSDEVLEITSQLDDTERGTGGFGSTGK